MLRAFLFVYFIGAYLLNNTDCSNITVKLNKQQKVLLMAGLDKLKIFNCGDRYFYQKKQDKYSLLIILWQMFWILFLILIPLCLKLVSIIILDSRIEGICRLYNDCFKNIKNIFYIEGVMVALDIIIRLIRNI